MPNKKRSACLVLRPRRITLSQIRRKHIVNDNPTVNTESLVLKARLKSDLLLAGILSPLRDLLESAFSFAVARRKAAPESTVLVEELHVFIPFSTSGPALGNVINRSGRNPNSSW